MRSWRFLSGQARLQLYSRPGTSFGDKRQARGHRHVFATSPPNPSRSASPRSAQLISITGARIALPVRVEPKGRDTLRQRETLAYHTQSSLPTSERSCHGCSSRWSSAAWQLVSSTSTTIEQGVSVRPYSPLLRWLSVPPAHALPHTPRVEGSS